MIDRYQDLARTGDTRPSRFVSSVSVILYFYIIIGGLIASIPMIYVLFTNWEAIKDPILMTDVMGFLEKYVSPIPNYIFTNLSIYCMLLGVFVSVKFIHYRLFTTLLTTKKRIQWSRFCIGFVVYGVLVLLGTLVDYFISPETYSITFDVSKFWIALPIILIMTPIQTATEELVFRGYVIQSFGLKIKNSLILSLLSGFLFTLPHLMNPEVYASNKLGIFSSICMILNYFVVGVVFALVTIKTNSLGIAMGAHAVNNLICFILVGYPDSVLPTNTVFSTTKFEPISGLISVIIVSIVFYYITLALAKEPKQPVSETLQEF